MIALILAAAALTSLDAAIRLGVDPCRDRRVDEITVCADHEQLLSPFRLPLQSEPEEGDPRARSVSRERNDLFDYDAGGNGTCSNVGAAGSAGCGFRKHKLWVLQRAGASDPRGPAYDK